MHRAGKRGLGTAYIEGFEWALARDYDYIFEMDADFSHDPADLVRLREPLIAGARRRVGRLALGARRRHAQLVVPAHVHQSRRLGLRAPDPRRARSAT